MGLFKRNQSVGRVVPPEALEAARRNRRAEEIKQQQGRAYATGLASGHVALVGRQINAIIRTGAEQGYTGVSLFAASRTRQAQEVPGWVLRNSYVDCDKSPGYYSYLALLTNGYIAPAQAAERSEIPVLGRSQSHAEYLSCCAETALDRDLANLAVRIGAPVLAGIQQH